jgi:PKD repeat protein
LKLTIWLSSNFFLFIVDLLSKVIYLSLLTMVRIFNLFFFLLPLLISAQISEGGFPYSYNASFNDKGFRIRELDAPNLNVVTEEDRAVASMPGPYRIGVAIQVDIDLLVDGTWSTNMAGRHFLRLGIKAENARGLILYYRYFSIPKGGKLFVYSKDKEQLIGAFTSINNPSGGYFATELIKGDEVVIEYDAPAYSTADPVIVIYQVHYVYKETEQFLKGESGPCEVNINCSEGQNWQNEKRSVAKIVLKAGAGTYLCTGTLVNNTRQDSIPYFLTARHCGTNASLSDYSQWVFHFNYESINCENPVEDPFSNTISGSTLLAQALSGTDAGSDFKLLELSQKLPENYNPYFSGWNRNGQASPSGVCIHHPKGDIKKISTYTAALVSTAYGQAAVDPDGKYWKVVWAETENGHGVTEGGSSGSPIFNPSGQMLGTLTGGPANCSNLTAPDYYGKFSFHWSSNGSLSNAQLKPYLDPDNSGVQSLGGFGYGNILFANFIADTTVVSMGGRVSFADGSSGDPEQWNWTFNGGEPSSYSGQDPSGITYYDYGSYDVILSVRDGESGNTLVRKDYIRVSPNIYPNPAHDYVVIDFGRRQLEFIEVQVYNVMGQLVREYTSIETTTGIYKIPLADVNSGTYILRIRTNIMEDKLRLVVY